ncbi:hypothetical protein BU204_10510 [Actinophytocola xanthii]|uniref:Uncharacterized protein n=2 Tax=Actinophytocola xanthii TaxID=1912961 RepID=A0A1Q8CTG3_9PSEU|nr:hypothetical protein BU204_10510 [Actinophytocola xanthii]
MGPLAAGVAKMVNSGLSHAFATRFKKFGERFAEIGVEGLHEMMTEVLYVLMKEGRLPEELGGAFTAGMVSGGAGVAGEWLAEVFPPGGRGVSDGEKGGSDPDLVSEVDSGPDPDSGTGSGSAVVPGGGAVQPPPAWDARGGATMGFWTPVPYTPAPAGTPGVNPVGTATGKGGEKSTGLSTSAPQPATSAPQPATSPPQPATSPPQPATSPPQPATSNTADPLPRQTPPDPAGTVSQSSTESSIQTPSQDPPLHATQSVSQAPSQQVPQTDLPQTDLSQQQADPPQSDPGLSTAGVSEAGLSEDGLSDSGLSDSDLSTDPPSGQEINEGGNGALEPHGPTDRPVDAPTSPENHVDGTSPGQLSEAPAGRNPDVAHHAVTPDGTASVPPTVSQMSPPSTGGASGTVFTLPGNHYEPTQLANLGASVERGQSGLFAIPGLRHLAGRTGTDVPLVVVIEENDNTSVIEIVDTLLARPEFSVRLAKNPSHPVVILSSNAGSRPRSAQELRTRIARELFARGYFPDVYAPDGEVRIGADALVDADTEFTVVFGDGARLRSPEDVVAAATTLRSVPAHGGVAERAKWIVGRTHDHRRVRELGPEVSRAIGDLVTSKLDHSVTAEAVDIQDRQSDRAAYAFAADLASALGTGSLPVAPNGLRGGTGRASSGPGHTRHLSGSSLGSESSSQSQPPAGRSRRRPPPLRVPGRVSHTRSGSQGSGSSADSPRSAWWRRRSPQAGSSSLAVPGQSGPSAPVSDGVELARRGKARVDGEFDATALRDEIGRRVEEARRRDTAAWPDIGHAFTEDEVARGFEKGALTPNGWRVSLPDYQITLRVREIGPAKSEDTVAGERRSVLESRTMPRSAMDAKSVTPFNPTDFLTIPIGGFVTTSLNVKGIGTQRAVESTIAEESEEAVEITETGEMFRREHDVVFDVTVQRMRGGKPRGEPVVSERPVTIPMALSWPKSLAQGIPDEYAFSFPQTSPGTPKALINRVYADQQRALRRIVAAPLEGLSTVGFDAAVTEHRLDSRKDPAVAEFGSWLAELETSHGKEILAGQVMRRAFNFRGRPTEVIVVKALAANPGQRRGRAGSPVSDTDSRPGTASSLGGRVSPDYPSGFGTSSAQQARITQRRGSSVSRSSLDKDIKPVGGSVSVEFGDVLGDAVGAKISAELGGAATAEDIAEYTSSQSYVVSKTFEGMFLKLGAEFEVVIAFVPVQSDHVGEAHGRPEKTPEQTLFERPVAARPSSSHSRLRQWLPWASSPSGSLRVPVSATVFAIQPGSDLDIDSEPESELDRMGDFKAGMEAAEVPSQRDAVYELTPETVEALAGSLAMMLNTEGRIRGDQIEGVRTGLRDWAQRNSEALARGRSEVRFPVPGEGDDLFVRGELGSGQRVAQPTQRRTGKSAVGGATRRQAKRTRELTGTVGAEVEVGPVGLGPAVSLAGSRSRSVGSSEGYSERHEWDDKGTGNTFKFHLNFTARLGPDLTKLGRELTFPSDPGATAARSDRGTNDRTKLLGVVKISVPTRPGEVLGVEHRAPLRETRWLTDEERAATPFPTMTKAYLPPDFDLQAMTEGADLALTATETLMAPKSEDLDEQARRELMRLALGPAPRPIGVQGDGETNQGTTQDAIEQWGTWRARQARQSLAAGPGDKLELASHTAAGILDMGSRDLVGSVTLTNEYGNPRIVRYDATHPFKRLRDTQTVLPAERAKGWSAKAAFTTSVEFTGGKAEPEVSGEYKRGRARRPAHAVETSTEYSWKEPAYLVVYDAVERLATSVHESWTGALGKQHPRPEITDTRSKFVPDQLAVWVPARQIAAIGSGLSDHDVWGNLRDVDRDAYQAAHRMLQPTSPPVSPPASPPTSPEARPRPARESSSRSQAGISQPDARRPVVHQPNPPATHALPEGAGDFDPSRSDLVVELKKNLLGELTTWANSLESEELREKYKLLAVRMTDTLAEKLLLGGFDAIMTDVLTAGHNELGQRTGESGKVELRMTLKGRLTDRTTDAADDEYQHKRTVSAARSVTNETTNTWSAGYSASGQPDFGVESSVGAFVLDGAIAPTVSGTWQWARGPARKEERRHTTTLTWRGGAERERATLELTLVLNPWARSGDYRKRFPPPLSRKPVRGQHIVPDKIVFEQAVQRTRPAYLAAARQRAPIATASGSLRNFWAAQRTAEDDRPVGFPDKAALLAEPIEAPKLFAELDKLSGELNANRANWLLTGARGSQLAHHLRDLLSTETYEYAVGSDTIDTIAIGADLGTRELIGVIPDSEIESEVVTGGDTEHRATAKNETEAAVLGGMAAELAGGGQTLHEGKSESVVPEKAPEQKVTSGGKPYLVRAEFIPTLTVTYADGKPARVLLEGGEVDGHVWLAVDEAGLAALGLTDPQVKGKGPATEEQRLVIPRRDVAATRTAASTSGPGRNPRIVLQRKATELAVPPAPPALDVEGHRTSRWSRALTDTRTLPAPWASTDRSGDRRVTMPDTALAQAIPDSVTVISGLHDAVEWIEGRVEEETSPRSWSPEPLGRGVEALNTLEARLKGWSGPLGLLIGFRPGEGHALVARIGKDGQLALADPLLKRPVPTATVLGSLDLFSAVVLDADGRQLPAPSARRGLGDAAAERSSGPHWTTARVLSTAEDMHPFSERGERVRGQVEEIVKRTHRTKRLRELGLEDAVKTIVAEAVRGDNSAALRLSRAIAADLGTAQFDPVDPDAEAPVAGLAGGAGGPSGGTGRRGRGQGGGPLPHRATTTGRSQAQYDEALTDLERAADRGRHRVEADARADVVGTTERREPTTVQHEPSSPGPVSTDAQGAPTSVATTRSPWNDERLTREAQRAEDELASMSADQAARTLANARVLASAFHGWETIVTRGISDKVLQVIAGTLHRTGNVVEAMNVAAETARDLGTSPTRSDVIYLLGDANAAAGNGTIDPAREAEAITVVRSQHAPRQLQDIEIPVADLARVVAYVATLGTPKFVTLRDISEAIGMGVGTLRPRAERFAAMLREFRTTRASQPTPAAGRPRWTEERLRTEADVARTVLNLTEQQKNLVAVAWTASNGPTTLVGRRLNKEVNDVVAHAMLRHSGTVENQMAVGMQVAAEIAEDLGTGWTAADLDNEVPLARSVQLDQTLWDQALDEVPQRFDRNQLDDKGYSFEDVAAIVALIAGQVPRQHVTVPQIAERLGKSVGVARTRPRHDSSATNFPVGGAVISDRGAYKYQQQRREKLRGRGVHLLPSEDWMTPAAVRRGRDGLDDVFAALGAAGDPTAASAIVFEIRDDGEPGLVLNVMPDGAGGHTIVGPTGRQLTKDVYEKLSGYRPTDDPAATPVTRLGKLYALGIDADGAVIIGNPPDPGSAPPPSPSRVTGVRTHPDPWVRLGLDQAAAVARRGREYRINREKVSPTRADEVLRTATTIVASTHDAEKLGSDRQQKLSELMWLRLVSSGDVGYVYGQSEELAAKLGTKPEGEPWRPTLLDKRLGAAELDAALMATSWTPSRVRMESEVARFELTKQPPEHLTTLVSVANHIVATSHTTGNAAHLDDVRILLVHRLARSPGGIPAVFALSEALAKSLGTALPDGAWLPSPLAVERGRASDAVTALSSTEWTPVRLSTEAGFARAALARVGKPDPDLRQLAEIIVLDTRDIAALTFSGLGSADAMIDVIEHVLLTAPGSPQEKEAAARVISDAIARGLTTGLRPESAESPSPATASSGRSEPNSGPVVLDFDKIGLAHDVFPAPGRPPRDAPSSALDSLVAELDHDDLVFDLDLDDEITPAPMPPAREAPAAGFDGGASEVVATYLDTGSLRDRGLFDMVAEIVQNLSRELGEAGVADVVVQIGAGLNVLTAEGRARFGPFTGARGRVQSLEQDGKSLRTEGDVREAVRLLRRTQPEADLNNWGDAEEIVALTNLAGELTSRGLHLDVVDLVAFETGMSRRAKLDYAMRLGFVLGTANPDWVANRPLGRGGASASTAPTGDGSRQPRTSVAPVLSAGDAGPASTEPAAAHAGADRGEGGATVSEGEESSEEESSDEELSEEEAAPRPAEPVGEGAGTSAIAEAAPSGKGKAVRWAEDVRDNGTRQGEPSDDGGRGEPVAESSGDRPPDDGDGPRDADPLDAARIAADEAAAAREAARLAVEQARLAHQRAGRAVEEAKAAAREAEGAVIGTERALDRARSRVAEARAQFEDANAHREALDDNASSDELTDVDAAATASWERLRELDLYADDALLSADTARTSREQATDAVRQAEHAFANAEAALGKARQSRERAVAAAAAARDATSDPDNRLRDLRGERDNLARAHGELTESGPSSRAATPAARNLAIHIARLDGQIARLVQDRATSAANARDQARAAQRDTERHRDEVKAAGGDVTKAAGVAKAAAKQGQVEAVYTLLSSVPPGSRATVERLGSATELIDAITELTGEELRDLGPDGVLAAMNNGELTVETSTGSVTIGFSFDLERPADTRTRTAPTSAPPSRYTRQGREAWTPLTDVSTSSAPVRIPLVVFEPVSVGTAVDPTGTLRPLVFVGGAAKRTTKTESTSSLSSEDATGDRPAVATTMAITLRRADGRTANANLDVTLRVGKIVPGRADVQPLTEARATVLRANGVELPAFTGTPDLHYVGTATAELRTKLKFSGPVSTVRGSDNAVGAGVSGGAVHEFFSWFVGLFAELNSGFAQGPSRTLEWEQNHTALYTPLEYRVDTEDGRGRYITVPVHVARAADLPLPEHLLGTEPVPTFDGRRFIVGTDSILDVPGAAAIVDIAADGLSEQGRREVAAHFHASDNPLRSPDQRRAVLQDAMSGLGHQITWVEDGRQHTVTIYAELVPPRETRPSGQEKARVEDKAIGHSGSAYSMGRSARAGLGFDFRPTFADDSGPTGTEGSTSHAASSSSRGLPVVAVTAGREETGSGKPRMIAKHGLVAWSDSQRDVAGTLDVVVVHTSEKQPGTARRILLGGTMTTKFGTPAAARRAEPPREHVDQAFAKDDDDNLVEMWPGNPDGTVATVTAGRVPNAIVIATPRDKLDWAGGKLSPSTMTPGVYLTSPPLPEGARPIPHALFGRYAVVEDFHASPRHREAVDLALAKSVQPVDGPPAGGTSRKSPRLGGTWSSPGVRRFVETAPDGTTTTYTVKLPPITRWSRTGWNTVREFLSMIGSRQFAGLTLVGQPATTPEMVASGRMSDHTATLTATMDVMSPDVLGIRLNGKLQINENGQHLSSAALSRSKGVGARFGVSVVPQHATKWGVFLRLMLGASIDWEDSELREVGPGDKQVTEYSGPTAFLVLDTRARLEAAMAIRNRFMNRKFDELPVTVDEPRALVVQLPVRDAIAIYEYLGQPVPPVLTAALPVPKPPKGRFAQTLLPPDGEYAGHNGTGVTHVELHGANPLAGAAAELNRLGVTGEWKDLVLTRIEEKLTGPHGFIDLRNILFAGDAEDGALVRVPNTGAVTDDVVHVRITATRADRPSTHSSVPPDSLFNIAYHTQYGLAQRSKSKTVDLPGDLGFVHREKPPASSTSADVETTGGGLAGRFVPSRVSRDQSVKDSSFILKVTSQFKYGGGYVQGEDLEVDFQLHITRDRSATPASKALTAGAAGLPGTRSTGSDDAPVSVPGRVVLAGPSTELVEPLREPATPPIVEVLTHGPDRGPEFTRQDGIFPFAIGKSSLDAIRRAGYAALSSVALPPGVVGETDLRHAAAARSEYSRKGSLGEYEVHGLTSGSSLHGGLHAMFTGHSYATAGDAKARRQVKHTFYDAGYSMGIEARFRLETATPLKPPAGAAIEGLHLEKLSQLFGTNKTVTHGTGVAALGSGSSSQEAEGPGQKTVRTLPTGALASTHDSGSAQGGRDIDTQSTKYSGEFFPFRVDADFYLKVAFHRSNDAANLFSSPDRTMRVGAEGDLITFVHRDLALRRWNLTLGHIWSFAGTRAPEGLALRVAGNGAAIEVPGRPATEPTVDPAAVADGDRGRNLHVGPGVTVEQVVSFVRSVKADWRPTTYTVEVGSPFTEADVREALSETAELDLNLDKIRARAERLRAEAPPERDQTGRDAVTGIIEAAIDPHTPGGDQIPNIAEFLSHVADIIEDVYLTNGAAEARRRAEYLASVFDVERSASTT